uniref:Uncharacterized protein n=1 Tax=Globodera rostochiensis TaxID=31243 RepID=A0A914HLW9_GLORO
MCRCRRRQVQAVSAHSPRPASMLPKAARSAPAQPVAIVNGRPIREMYCAIAGASRYTGGQDCDYCEAGTASAHPASNLVDGTPNWYQSPPLSRGMAYSEVNITIDLEQEFQIVSMFIQMANSPKPGAWFLERSADFGKTYQTWQYFATTAAECLRLFGIRSLLPIIKDDDVFCSSDFGRLVPTKNAEMSISLVEGRPSKNNVGGSPMLKQFIKATNVRLRLLRPSHLMDLYSNRDRDATLQYYYGIKELHLLGRCICNGHSANCEAAHDPSRPRARLCLCEHNTEGDQCERCKSGYVQKKWRASHDTDPFVCEPCNCHGHSGECVYEQELDMNNASLDIHGKSLGGGRCLNCQHNTQGINCNQCTPGFYRPTCKQWTDLDVCQPCRCDPTKHTGNCAEESGNCECLAQFTGPNCDQCAAGYYHPPECRPWN